MYASEPLCETAICAEPPYKSRQTPSATLTAGPSVRNFFQSKGTVIKPVPRTNTKWPGAYRPDQPFSMMTRHFPESSESTARRD